MSCFALTSFFALGNGHRMCTQCRLANGQIINAWHIWLDTTVQMFGDGAPLPAHIRMYAGAGAVVHPHMLVAYAFFHIYRAPGQPLQLEVLNIAVFPGA